MKIYVPAGPVLSLTDVHYNQLTAQWTDISQVGVPIVGYTLYRGTGAQPSSFAIIAIVGAVLSYVDTNVTPGATYTYYVVGKYESGIPTSQSNFATAFIPFGIENIYAYKSDGTITVLNVADVNNPAQVANVNLGLDATLSQTMAQDSRYLYVQAGSGAVSNKIYIIDWATNKLSPSLKKTLTGKSGSFDGGLLVRRGMADRNNLMFLISNTNQIESWNITDPENPTLIQAVASPSGTYNGRGFAYEPSSNRLYFGARGSFTGYCYLPVNADGTFGSGAAVVIHPTFDLILNGTAVMDGLFWSQYPNDANSAYYGYTIPTATVNAGLSQGSNQFGWFPGRFKSNGIKLLMRSLGHVSFQAVMIATFATGQGGVVHAQLGGTSNICGGLVSFGNFIYFFVNNFLYIYDISNPDSPVQKSALNLGGTYINFSSFPDDSWYGNNGFCVA